MTKEELRAHCERQVKMCEKWAKGNGKEPSGKIYEKHKLILDLIKALEQQPCDDCVSRAEVLNLVRFNAFHVKSQIKAIENLPPVTPTQSWIPVSERLPEEDGEYLLFGKIDEDEENYIFIGEYDSCGEQFGIWQEQFDRTTLGCLGSEFFEYSSVLAWQPLPQPYEGKE